MPVHPNALTVHENGDIIFTDCMCQNITAVNMAGIQTHTFGSVVSDRVDKLENRCAVAVVPSNLPDAGCFVVVDGKSNQILVFGPNYDFRLAFGSGRLKRPRGVVVVPAGVKGAGNIVVVDTGNQRIVEFDMGGNYQSMWKAANFLAEAVAIIPYGVPGAGNIVLVEAKLTLSRRALSVHGLILGGDSKNRNDGPGRCALSFRIQSGCAYGGASRVQPEDNTKLGGKHGQTFQPWA